MNLSHWITRKALPYASYETPNPYRFYFDDFYTKFLSSFFQLLIIIIHVCSPNPSPNLNHDPNPNPNPCSKTVPEDLLEML
jgi:hypothetical protein